MIFILLSRISWCILLHLTPSSHTASIIGELVSISPDYYSSLEAWDIVMFARRWSMVSRRSNATSLCVSQWSSVQRNATRCNARRCNARRRDTTASHSEWRHHGDRRVGHTNSALILRVSFSTERKTNVNRKRRDSRIVEYETPYLYHQ